MGSFQERIGRLFEPGDAGPTLTDALVADAQARLGVPLPDDLLALLRVQNGGYVRDEFAACPTSRPTSWAEDHVSVEDLMGIGPRPSHGLSLLDSPDLNEEWGQPRELVLLTGDGHWWIALDYRTRRWRRREPRVVFYDNDTDPHEELVLAPSFRAFVERLGPAPPVDEEDLPDIGLYWRDHLASLARFLDPPYRAAFRPALSNEAVRSQVRAELRDFGHRLDPRFATPVAPNSARDALLAEQPPNRVVLFHADREPFGGSIGLEEGLELLLGEGGGILSCRPARLALYAGAPGSDLLLLRRD